MNSTENSIIVTAILHPHAVASVIELSEQHFKNKKNKIIFNVIRDLYSRDIPVTTSSIQAQLVALGEYENAGGSQHISEILQSESLPSIKYFINKLKETDTKQRMILHAKDLASGRITKDEFLKNIEDSDDCYDPDKSVNLSDISDKDLDDVFKSNNFFKSGIEKYDSMNGGLWKGELIVIGARPSVGKSAFALNLARNINNTILFSLEMSRTELYSRFLARETGIDSRKIKLKNLESDEAVKIYQTHKELKNKYSLEFVDKIFNVYDIVNHIKKQAKVKRVDCAIIDYLQLINIDSHENRNIKIGEITRNLKQLAASLEIPIIVLSQLGRGSLEKKRPTMADLRESGNIEQDANVIFLMFYNEDLRCTELIVEKNRDGQAGYTINFKFYKEISTFKEIKEEVF